MVEGAAAESLLRSSSRVYVCDRGDRVDGALFTGGQAAQRGLQNTWMGALEKSACRPAAFIPTSSNSLRESHTARRCQSRQAWWTFANLQRPLLACCATKKKRTGRTGRESEIAPNYLPCSSVQPPPFGPPSCFTPSNRPHSATSGFFFAFAALWLVRFHSLGMNSTVTARRVCLLFVIAFSLSCRREAATSCSLSLSLSVRLLFLRGYWVSLALLSPPAPSRL